MSGLQHCRFVVVSGLPGSGKTTVGRQLAAALHLPLLDKDDILVRLFETRGTGDQAWRRALSRASDEVLERDARASEGAVLVSFWRLPGMPEDSGTPTEWLSELHGLVIGVRCVCLPEVAAARFIQRQRHPGHLDHERALADVLASLQAQEQLGALRLEPSIDVDTSQLVDAEALAKQVQAAFSRSARFPLPK
jgi:predicted kinase